MRGSERQQGVMFSYVSLDKRVAADHPLRPIREMTDGALKSLSARFSHLHSKTRYARALNRPATRRRRTPTMPIPGAGPGDCDGVGVGSGTRDDAD